MGTVSRRHLLAGAAVLVLALLLAMPARAAITVRGTSYDTHPNSTTTTISLPSGTTTGDVTVINATQQETSGQGWTVPSGWTAIVNNGGFIVVYRVYQGGDPSSVTFTSAASSPIIASAISYIGVDNSTPVDASNFCFFGTVLATPFRAPSLAPSWVGDRLLAVYADNSGISNAITLPSGLTSELPYTYGPNSLLADATLTTGATPDYDTTGGGNTALAAHMGVQIAFKAAGATAATQPTAYPTWAGSYYQGFTSPTQAMPLALLAPQNGDLVVVFITAAGLVTASPSGYSLKSTAGPSTSQTTMWTHTYGSGDTLTPTWTSGGDPFYSALLFRKQGSGGSNPVYDTSGFAVGSGTGTAATPSLTRFNATEMLLTVFGDGNGTGTSWSTIPGGLTIDENFGSGPSVLFGWVQPASSPTGSFTAAVAASSDTVTGTAALISCFGARVFDAPHLISFE